MGAKLNVYNLGEKGVNTSKTPLHHEDGEFLSAQNAEFYAEAGIGGLRKRPGLQRFNTSSLTNPVKGVFGVPLPGPGERGVYVDIGMTTTPWHVTHDGSTFAASDGFQQFGPVLLKSVSLLGQFFFVSLATGSYAVNGFDGETEFELYRFQAITIINRVEILGTHDNKIIVRESDTAGPFAQRIRLIDPLTNDVTQVADIVYTAFRPFEHSGTSFLGKVWVGYPGATFAEIRWAREGDTSWTLDRTHASNRTVTSMRVYQGELYVAYSADPGTAAVIEKRTAAGVWSTVRTGSGSTDLNYFADLTVHQNKLYAFYKHGSAAGDTAEIHVNASGVWSIDKDLDAVDPTVAVTPARLLSVGFTVFASIDADATLVGGIWKKVGAGAWTRANALQLAAGAGNLAVI